MKGWRGAAEGDPTAPQPLPAATVVDVGAIAGLGWACVEQNTAWGAGIHGCDPARVPAVLQRTSLKLDNKGRR
ncbi:hypothetical protein [Massilia violaceinigra]|uniref:hypothetical protein n=1 Tax=Massilia violaceinigra TaxID=2045208 RepID=UPI001FB2F1DF|nr:hypothetical protein [Massilia violaceinigra]